MVRKRLQACFRKVKRALFIRAIFFLVTASINVSLLPVHSTTSCPSSTTDFFGISLEKNSFKSNSYFMRQSTTIWWTKRLLVIAKVRTQRTCALYCNSTLTFRTLLKLIFDIELNPGPNGSFNCSVKANTRNINNIKIAHINVLQRIQEVKVSMHKVKKWCKDMKIFMGDGWPKRSRSHINSCS